MPALNRRSALGLAMAAAACVPWPVAAAQAFARGRDGRILLPVLVNDRGPFRFVLDTGSAVSAVSRFLGTELRLPAAAAGPVTLQGATGAAQGELVLADRIGVDALSRERWTLMSLSEGLGGADGVLGADVLRRQRLDLRLGEGSFTLGVATASHAATASDPNLEPLPTLRRFGDLLEVRIATGARGGRAASGNSRQLAIRAILDTGAQRTVGNTALRRALGLEAADVPREAAVVRGPSGDAIAAEQIVTPGFAIGPVRYPSQPLLYADLPVFDAWGWKSRPAILLGMDLLGRLDRLVIDYSRPRVWVAPT